MQSKKQAAAEPADSGGDGRPPQVAGNDAARPEDRMTLLLRLFPLASSAGTHPSPDKLEGSCPALFFYSFGPFQSGSFVCCEEIRC